MIILDALGVPYKMFSVSLEHTHTTFFVFCIENIPVRAMVKTPSKITVNNLFMVPYSTK